MNQKGQTAVEYILLVAVLAAMIISVMTKVKTYMVDAPDSVFTKYLNSYTSMLGGSGADGNQLTYKRFPLRR
jgi:Flp pilus assembly pilin Flp